MAGLVPVLHAVRLQRPFKALHDLRSFRSFPQGLARRVDSRDKPGHDGECNSRPPALAFTSLPLGGGPRSQAPSEKERLTRFPFRGSQYRFEA